MQYEVELRCADRYMKGQRGEELAELIVSGLKYWDYKETVDFYEAFEKGGPSLEDRALLASNDRYYLFTEVLGRRDGLHPWLHERCREVELNPDGYLDLWAREHYKSSLITFAGIIQEVIQDPEITVALFSWSKKIAEAFVLQIQQELERNIKLKQLFPDVFYFDPRKDSSLWSTPKGLVVKRKGNPREPTISGWGLDHQPTSMHFKLRVYDDVVTQKNVTNPDQIKKTTEGMELSDNLSGGKGRFWMIGTRYTFADTWGVQIERRLVKVRLYPATDNGRLDGEPVYFTKKKWEHKKKAQPAHISAQMLQNPTAGNDATFHIHWFRPWFVRPYAMNVYIMGDPSRGRSKKSDRTAFSAVGIGPGGAKYLLDGVRHRMSLSERWQFLKALHQKWTKTPGVQMVKVGYEVYGLQSDVEYFQERMRLENYDFGIEELNWVREGNQSKIARVSRLQPDFQNGRFYIPGLVWHESVGASLSSPSADYGARVLGMAGFTNGEAYWSVKEGVAQVEYREALGLTRDMQRARSQSQDYLMTQMLKRKDEDGRIYDLTRALIEEMLFFPVAPRDDLVDCVSRVYDMTPLEPAQFERFNEEAIPDHWDA
jgi:phage terminase large subunit-like protein